MFSLTYHEFIVMIPYYFLGTLKVAELVASEFFEQGDIERSEYSSDPIVSGVFCFHYLTLLRSIYLLLMRGRHSMSKARIIDSIFV